jgi:recombination protein RecT
VSTEIQTIEMNSALDKPKAIEALLDTRSDELNILLAGTDVTPAQFTRGVVLGLATADPKVLKATRNSVLLACLEAAQMGLVPSGQFGGAYLVAYGTEAQLIVDWRGYIKMALRSGQVRKVEADNVYSNDDFDYQRGTEEFIRHRPTLEADRGGWSHTYAIATLTNGEKQFEVLTTAQVEAIRGGRKQTWVSHPEEMRRKTAVRRLFKYIPQAITPQLQFALERDDRLDREVTVEPMPSPRRSLAAAVIAGDEEPTQEGMDPEEGLPE